MGVLGEMFPGRKLADSGDEDSDGQRHQPRFDIDLDSGVVRLAGFPAAAADDGPADDIPGGTVDPGGDGERGQPAG